MEPQSSFAFLVAANDAFGYTHKQTLDSSLVTILAMFKEYGFVMNERNKAYDKKGDDELNDGEEWVYITDFKTGQQKKVKRAKSI